MSENEIHLPDGLDASAAKQVLREYATTEDAQIVTQDTLESLRDEINEAKEAFAAVLAEESPQSAETLARQDMDALTEPFRDDEGDIEVDTLTQQPQTGNAGGGGGTESDDGPVDVDTLSRDEANDIRRKRQKITTFESRDMDGRAGEIKGEIADTLGADSYDEVQADVEGL